jgi:magnesium-transporting ATPase (P-type)
MLDLNWSDNQNMRYDAEILSSAKEPTSLLGLRVSAGLLVALGCLWGIYALFFVIVFGVSGFRAWKGHASASDNPRWFATLILVVTITTALTWLCFRAAVALRDARRWAYVAMTFGMLLLLFTASFIYDIYHPERQSPDEYFGILFVPFSLLVGLWWCIYLNLPHVRAHLNSSHSS